MAYTKSELDSIIKYYEEGFQKPWSQFTPQEKVDVYNERGITPEDFATYGASVDTETLNYMKGLGYKPYSYGFQSFDTAEERDAYINEITARVDAAKAANLERNADTVTNLIEQSMMTGVPSNAFDPYGGYQEALDYYLDKGGGTLSLDSPTITQTEIKEAAKKIAETGQGNMAVLDAAKQLATEETAKKSTAPANTALAGLGGINKIYNIGGLQWDSGASLETKKGYVQDLLKTYTPDQVKSIIKYNDPENATDANFKLLGLPEGAPTSPTPTGFRSPYQAPTQLAPAKGLGSLVSQYVGQPNLRTTTRSIGPSGMGALVEQPSAALSYARGEDGIGEAQYFQNIKDFFAQPGVTPQAAAEQMSRYGIPETDVMSAIGLTPTQFFAQEAAKANALAAKQAAAAYQPTKGIAALPAPPLTYGGAPIVFSNTTGPTSGTTASGDLSTRTNEIADVGYFGDPDTSVESVVVKRKGGPIAFAEGKEVMAGEKKFSFEDFGLTPATVETARVQKIFDYPRNVLFNPELRGLEALVASRMTPRDYEDLLIRQGRTGREYASYLPDIRVGGAATGNVRPLNYYYAEGGDVGRGLGSIAMKGYAQEMAQKGRFGDTMLAHISPEEAQMLQAAGGAGTINPYTGLPEYFSWRKLLRGIAKVGQFVVPFIPGIGIPMKVALSALAGGLAGPQKGFDFKRGLISGALAFGGAKIAEGLGAASGVSGAPASAGADIAMDTAQKFTDPNLMAGNVGTGAPFIGGTPVTELTGGSTYGLGVASSPSSTVPSEFASFNPPRSVVFDSAGTIPGDVIYGPSDPVMQGAAPEPSYGNQILDTSKKMYSGAENIISGTPGASKAFTEAAGFSPTTALAGTAAGLGTLSSYDETAKFQIQQAIANAKTEEEKQQFTDLFKRLFGPLASPPVSAASGGMMGLSALAAGGATGPANAPRTINGAGDGMSDSVPATIEGIQEARLADGEFVIPADVVADLGNGSSNAGSKKLYAMMDRIRQSRHGTTKQPPEVNMGRLMPA